MNDRSLPNTQPTIKECELDDGRIVEYDICSRDKYTVSDRNCRFLGRGVIYKINGAVANDTAPKFFWKRIK